MKDVFIMEEKTHFTMRINTKLWEKVKELAFKNKRSAVKQVEFILEEYLEKFVK